MNKVPLSEYPRPQLYRDSYKSLNGEWDYAISKNSELPTSYQGQILVPFSPETKLSGVNHILQPDEYLFYHLSFKLDDLEIKDKVLLHFLAVDQIADVYLNGGLLGSHEGGFTPFEFEIKDHLKDINDLVVRVKDYTDTSYLSRGKQKLKHGGIWYTPQSGIYFPVFIESVTSDYIRYIEMTPNIDKEEIVFYIESFAEQAELHIFDMDRPIDCNREVHIKVKDMRLWSPEDPYLYFIRLTTPEGDVVSSYFAMRKFSLVKDEKGITRIGLNNKPYFLRGVLDQGYYKDGLLTPSSYDDYVKDIELVKSLGFNMIRKHIKIEIPRWYFECDKRGIVVFQDFINGGSTYPLTTITLPLVTGKHIKDDKYKKFGRESEVGRNKAIDEFLAILRYLKNTPCIGLWTIFNEGWGQFDSKILYETFKVNEPNRLFDHASGWHDQGSGDVESYHVYFKHFKLDNKPRKRAVFLSEFGGFVLPIKGHMMKGNHVYKSFKNEEDWLNKYKDSIEKDVIENIPKGLSAIVYTQLSDVEEELNGFVTFDREVIKVDPNKIKEINDKAKY